MLPEFARQQLSNQAYKPHRSAEFELNASRTALIKQRQPPMRGNTAHNGHGSARPLRVTLCLLAESAAADGSWTSLCFF